MQVLNSAQVGLLKQTSISLLTSEPISLSHFFWDACMAETSARPDFPALNRPKLSGPISFSIQASHSGLTWLKSGGPWLRYCSIFLRSSSLIMPWSLANLKQISWFSGRTQRASQSALLLQLPGPEVILYFLASAASPADIKPALTAKSTHSSMRFSSLQ